MSKKRACHNFIFIIIHHVNSSFASFISLGLFTGARDCMVCKYIIVRHMQANADFIFSVVNSKINIIPKAATSYDIIADETFH